MSVAQSKFNFEISGAQALLCSDLERALMSFALSLTDKKIFCQDCTALFGTLVAATNTLLLLTKVIYSLPLTTVPINILQGKSYISSSPSIKKETGKASGRQGKGGQACNHFCNKGEPTTLFFSSSLVL